MTQIKQKNLWLPIILAVGALGLGILIGINWICPKIQACDPPTFIKADSITPTSITYNWDTLTPNLGQIVQVIDVTNDSIQPVIFNDTVSGPPLTLNNLKPGHTYQICLQNICTGGNSPKICALTSTPDFIIIEVVEVCPNCNQFESFSPGTIVASIPPTLHEFPWNIGAAIEWHRIEIYRGPTVVSRTWIKRQRFPDNTQRITSYSQKSCGCTEPDRSPDCVLNPFVLGCLPSSAPCNLLENSTLTPPAPATVKIIFTSSGYGFYDNSSGLPLDATFFGAFNIRVTSY